MNCLVILPGSFGIVLCRLWNVLFWNKTMGWKNFCLQLLVRCPFALYCIPSSFGGGGGCAWVVHLWSKQKQSWKKNPTPNAAFSFTKSHFVVRVAVFCFGFFSEQVFFLFCPCLVLPGCFYLFFSVDDTLFLPTCYIFFFFFNSQDVCIA